jgi:hypothetical protein
MKSFNRSSTVRRAPIRYAPPREKLIVIDNERIRPAILMSEDLAPNPAVIKFPMAALNLLPPAVHHTLVCLSINHYIHSLPVGADKSIATGNRSKIYQHRGAAIRALSQYVAKDQTRCNDLSISSILVFMSMEVRYHHSNPLAKRLQILKTHSYKTHPWQIGVPTPADSTA